MPTSVSAVNPEVLRPRWGLRTICAASGGADRLRDAEIRHHRRTAGEQHVLGLDVAMHDAAAVRVGKRACNVAKNGDRFGRRNLSAREPRTQRLAVHERHDVEQKRSALAIPSVGSGIELGMPCVHGTGVEQRQDIRVLEAGGQTDLRDESFGAEDRG